MVPSQVSLLGGDRPWNSSDWVASDDRVRGGKSQSYFDCSPSQPSARFHGNLDIKALGGAGFASQRTTGEDRSWDLSNYDGLQLDIEQADDKQYTLTLKDDLLPPNPENGREQSTISYEYDFRVQSQTKERKSTILFIPWDQLKATYRGREKKDAAAPKLKDIKRISLLMRSFFGSQEGPFSLSLISISATTKTSTSNATNNLDVPTSSPTPYNNEGGVSRELGDNDEKDERQGSQNHGILGWLSGMCTVQ
ncbi:MAG: hypothetical protein M1827_006425 [Pycnora praestabilis]|nr:MAG: hypothetical protein M1827_006425 [Pycnora praestabilis]